MAERSESERAKAFAKAYVSLVEALMQEGVLEEIARDEARMAAMTQLRFDDEAASTGERCPLCGRGN